MTESNYDAIVQANLQAAFALGAAELAVRLEAESETDGLAWTMAS